MKDDGYIFRDSYWWVEVYWRCTNWQVGYIYVDGRPSIEFVGVDEDQGEPPAGANIFDCLTDSAKGEVYMAFGETIEKAKYIY